LKIIRVSVTDMYSKNWACGNSYWYSAVDKI